MSTLYLHSVMHHHNVLQFQIKTEYLAVLKMLQNSNIFCPIDYSNVHSDQKSQSRYYLRTFYLCG